MRSKTYIALLLLLVVAGCMQKETVNQRPNVNTPLVGNNRDSHGCIGSAGYTWCELKSRCLRTWEDPCVSDAEVAAVKDYLTQNISELSPQKEVLGGKFYITNVRFTKPGEAFVNYEDGHIALQGTLSYEYKDSTVSVLKFEIDTL